MTRRTTARWGTVLGLAMTGGLAAGAPVQADVYAYVNDAGDYTISRERPGDEVAEYAILSDEGEFLRLVRPSNLDAPVSHWRPWFIPKDPDPFDGPSPDFEDREGTVEIEERGPVRPVD